MSKARKEIPELQLDYRFYRCHRSYIVNTDNIKEVNFQKLTIYMENGEICPISVRAKTRFKKYYNEHLISEDSQLKEEEEKFTKQTSRSPENKLQEVYISNSNNTKYNNTNINNTESNLILSINRDLLEENMDHDEMRCDEIEEYSALTETIVNDKINMYI